jgi:SAM-dependent methyltransferase
MEGEKLEEWTGEVKRPIRVWTDPKLKDDIYLHFSEILKQVKIYSPRFNGRILDIGAGKTPYKEFFNCKEYITLDNRKYKNIDLVADITKKIPLKKDSIDGVLCFQVLEHVKKPQKVIDEIHRILKPGGKCLLTTHMAAPLHGEPYDYYRFTKYGLKEIFKDFKKIEIRPNGGTILSIFQLIVWGVSDKFPKFLAKPLIILLNFIGKKLDKILQDSRFTLNYSIFAIK